MLLKKTLSEQIYHILREDILHQNIPCGTKLTLKALQERFQVSSSPIREALTRLSQEQLVSYYSNVGVNVIELTRADVEEIYQLMGDLDALAVGYSAEGGNASLVLTALEKNLAACRQEGSSTARWNTLSDEFHLIFYTHCGNGRLCATAEHLRAQMSILAYRYQLEPQAQAEILQEHEGIYASYKVGNIPEACRRMKAHLNHSMEYALGLIQADDQ